MDAENILRSLHPIEKKILPVLEKTQDFDSIAKESGLKEIEVSRGLYWLSGKGIVELEEESEDVVVLDKNGILYSKKGLPERRFLETLKKLGRDKVSVSEILEHSSLEKDEVNICIGSLKKKMAVEIEKDGELCFSITDYGKKLLGQTSLEEKFLNLDFPVLVSSLSDEEKYAFDELKKRKQIVKIDNRKHKKIKLTKLGKEVIKQNSLSGSKDSIGKLTPEMIVSGSWKKSEFREYDVKAQVPSTFPGKRHFVNQAIRYIKQVWLELGFKEMTGNHVQTAFRDLDALFVPQDHPAREMQDTFYINDPASGGLPSFSDAVKKMHESGDADSTGWRYVFSEDESKRNLLRTHTTVLSAEVISKLKKEDLPVKVFAVGKVYRNEALDWKHLFEFSQVEGIVIDPNANLGHLIGYLKEFYTKLGFSDVRVRPAHFPYTEPSLEVEVYHPKKKQWIELGGAGIFRPEVVKPLRGIDVPVLAWGQGLERGIVEYFDFSNLRDLYRNDIKKIKEMKYWMK
ncbi:MAG: phenylalanine--tRNA ligase subunit alpha [Nanoarchaeota archaeon]